LDELNPVLDLGEAGLGEKDTDPPIPDENPPAIVDEIDAVPEDAQTAFYEDGFVDGEDAFVDADEVTIKTPIATAIDNEEEPRSE